jgi:hypothetical protein
MKWFVRVMTIFIVMFSFEYVEAASYIVPFNNVALNPNNSLTAGYSFGNNKIIFCYTPDLATTGVITWPYKGVIKSGSLPMSLTTDSNVTGQLADANGTITIRNNQNATILVSCDLAF